MGLLEFARTQEILRRELPAPPAVVLDVGGGPGAYALWLAREGYEVHLVDPVPLHLEQARAASRCQPDHPVASFTLGDARFLNHAGGANAVLMLGPLYHLTDRAERVMALREACRVLHAGGVAVASAISRFASALDGLVRGLFTDPRFAPIVVRDLREGQHRNETQNPSFFTTAYFHRPEELKSEMEEAGLLHTATLAVEGPAWMLQDLEAKWNDPRWREIILDIIRRIEEEPALSGASAHIIGVGRRPER